MSKRAPFINRARERGGEKYPAGDLERWTGGTSVTERTRCLGVGGTAWDVAREKDDDVIVYYISPCEVDEGRRIVLRSIGRIMKEGKDEWEGKSLR